MSRPLDRRAFLRLLALTGGTLMASSCRPGRSRPTPTPTRTPRPPAPTNTWTPAASATPSATWTPAATDTPAPTTAPTATPTPTATPFPPGPATKLGLHIARNEPRVFELIATGNVAVVKTIEYDSNFVSEIKSLSPDTLIVARMDLPEIDLANLDDPKAAAQAFAERLLPIATEQRRMAAITAWESHNEPVANDESMMRRYAEFEAHRTRLLAAEGIRSVIGNFSTGSPDLSLWPAFRPALEAAIEHKGFLGLHEYSAPTMQFGTSQDPLGWRVDGADEGWLTLRYRKVYRGYLEPNDLMLPLMITETGIDGGIVNRPGPAGLGWMDFAAFWDELGMGTDAPGNYVEQLAWYDAHLQQDPYVVGAAIFAAAAWQGWTSFEILDQVLPVLKQYLSVHPLR